MKTVPGVQGLVPDKGSRNGAILISVLLFVMVFGLFGRSIGFSFVNLDDADYVYNNPPVLGGLTTEGVRWAFTNFHSSNWHPLTWMSHMLDCQIYGTWPGGHHLTNVLLHAVNAILLFLFLRETTGYLFRSAFVSLVFAIHPLRVESVVWVAERKDLLAGLFFLLALLAYVRYVRNSRDPESIPSPSSNLSASFLASGWYWLTAFLFALGLLSKPMIVTLPFVLLLLDYWPLGRLPGKAPGTRSPGLQIFLEKIPFFALSIGSCLITLQAQTIAMAPTETFPLPYRFMNASISYVTYIVQLFWPVDLAVLYPLPKLINTLMSLGSAILLLLLSLWIWMLRSTRPYLLFGWLWYLGMAVPVIGIVHVGAQAHADRYTYLPLIGLCVAIIWLIAELSSAWKYRRTILAVGTAACVATLSACTWAYAGHWRNSITLWETTLERTRNNSAAHVLLGLALYQAGRPEEAATQYEKALEIAPNYTDALNELGVISGNQQNWEEAFQFLQRSLMINPHNPKTLHLTGAALIATGRLDEAEQLIEKTLELQPVGAEVYLNLGLLRKRQGNLEEAADSYRKALSLQPDNAAAHHHLASVISRTGEPGPAIGHFRRAIQLGFENAASHVFVAEDFLKNGQSQEALRHFQRALELAKASGQTDLSVEILRRISEVGQSGS